MDNDDILARWLREARLTSLIWGWMLLILGGLTVVGSLVGLAFGAADWLPLLLILAVFMALIGLVNLFFAKKLSEIDLVEDQAKTPAAASPTGSAERSEENGNE